MAAKKMSGKRSSSGGKRGSVTSSFWHIRWLPRNASLIMRHFEEAPSVLEIRGVPHALAAVVERRAASSLPTTVHFQGRRKAGEDMWHARFHPQAGVETHP